MHDAGRFVEVRPAYASPASRRAVFIKVKRNLGYEIKKSSSNLILASCRCYFDRSVLRGVSPREGHAGTGRSATHFGDSTRFIITML